MTLQDLVNKLSLNVLSNNEGLQNVISGGYVSDMLSDVLANSKEGNIWITLQTHQNTVAIASVRNLAGIIIVNKRQPDEETLKKAEQEKITIMTTPLSAFEVVGRIYKLVESRG